MLIFETNAVICTGLLKPCISSIVDTDTTDELRTLALENLANISQSSTGVEAIKKQQNIMGEIVSVINKRDPLLIDAC